jgi:hypothetical protein
MVKEAWNVFMKGAHHFLHGMIKNKKGSDEQVEISTKISRITTCQIERMPGTPDLLRQPLRIAA